MFPVCGLRRARRHDTTRRLAAIVVADVAGYSRLIGADERLLPGDGRCRRYPAVGSSDLKVRNPPTADIGASGENQGLVQAARPPR
jgi:hypothetical protein